MSKRYGLTGLNGTVELSKGGAKVKNSSGVIEARNSADDAYAIVRGATASGDNDLITKAQFDAAIGGQVMYVSQAITFETSGTFNIGSAVATAKRILSVRVIVDTLFNGTTPTLEIGITGTTDLLMATTDNNLKLSDSYAKDPVYVTSGSTQFIGTYVADSSSAGAGIIVIEYV